jgi:hypothetical protein
MSHLKRMWEVTDPMPADLLDRVRSVVRLEVDELELFRLLEDTTLAGARGDERARVITFELADTTMIVNVTPADDDGVRLDGWLDPPNPCVVELQTGGGVIPAEVNDEGRFVVARAPAGPGRLMVRSRDGARVASTPVLDL